MPTDITKAIEQAMEGMEPVAWRDATHTELHSLIFDHQKENMIYSGGRQYERSENYSEPLYTAGQLRAALERAILEAEARGMEKSADSVTKRRA